MPDPLIVALAILGVFLVLIVVAMLRFQAATFLKFWAALGPIFGGVIGTIGAYYFQQDQVKNAEAVTRQLARTVEETRQEHEQLGGQLAGLQNRLNAPGVATRPEVAAVATDLGKVREKFQVQGVRLDTALTAVPKRLLSPARPPER
jgi:hypothetical protein